jgi:L-histidine Nalpha-methyltransferase
MSMTKELDEATRAFADDVRRGLGERPKALPPRYFYDALGSQLFEAICQLPWYPITRSETRQLERHARAMVAPFPGPLELVELGSGSGEKLALLLRALEGRAVDVRIIDISEKAIELSRSALARAVRGRIVAHCAPYEEGLRALASSPRSAGAGGRLVCFLGSNIGNFDPPDARALLAAIRGALGPGDGLLLGADLVRAEAELMLAYDDPLGVTAAFNKNVLQRINTELGGDFDLAAFDHRAVWNAGASRVEMHLASSRRQTARVPGAGVVAYFDEGETILTECSYKYTPEGIVDLCKSAGLHRRDQWIEEDGGFSTTLLGADA